nr:Arc family DNA-binding protein [uncultured Pseudogulbenkiania sp.]
MPNAHKLAQFPVRMPPELRAWLEERAKRNSRSMNGEIIAILREKKDAEESQRKGS